MISHYPLVFAENYYISISGYVYYKEKTNRLKPFYKGESLYVTINSTDYKLLNLMLEYFAREKIGCKITRIIIYRNNPLVIPLWNITFEESDSSKTSEYDERIMDRFKCDIKASSSNKRCHMSIDRYDVLSILKKHDFKCKYCGKELGYSKWHLDHVKPLALGGLNTVVNLAPACVMCNLMKGAFDENEFLIKCERIIKYNNFINGKRTSIL